MVKLIIFHCAILLAQNGQYDAALPLLNNSVLGVDEAERPLHHFWRAVSAYQTFHQKEATESCDYICEGFRTDIPVRYAHLCDLMRSDMALWKDDLHGIRARMGDVTKKLEVSRVGKPTMDQQKKIVELLDRKIKQLEDSQKESNSGASDGSQDNGGNHSNSPAETSKLPGGGGKGIVDSKEFKAKMAQWGTLPTAERKRLEQEISRDLPAKYRPMIELYFKSLNKLETNK